MMSWSMAELTSSHQFCKKGQWINWSFIHTKTKVDSHIMSHTITYNITVRNDCLNKMEKKKWNFFTTCLIFFLRNTMLWSWRSTKWNFRICRTSLVKVNHLWKKILVSNVTNTVSEHKIYKEHWNSIRKCRFHRKISKIH